MFISLLLIIIGGVFLLKNLGLIGPDVWGIIWPLAVIIFGAYIALKTQRCRMFWHRIWKKLE